MPAPYDTPPEGDFVRYVERLSRSAPTGVEPSRPRRAGRPPRRPTPAAAPAASAWAPLGAVLRVALTALVLYVMAVALLPSLAVLGGPLLLAVAAYAFLRLRRLPWRDLSKNR